MPGSIFPSYEGGCLALLGRGLVGWFGYLDRGGFSLGFEGTEIGDVSLYNSNVHAP